MKRFITTLISIAYIFVFLISVNAQTERSKTYLNNATIEEQINHVINESSKWEQYKMVLETWMNRLRTNTLDTLNSKNLEIAELQNLIINKDAEIESLAENLTNTKQDLENAVKEKNSFSIFGISLSKGLFLSIVVILLLSMLILTAFALLLFQRSNLQTRKTKKDLDALQEEFESYRQTSRHKYEQMAIQHHKEIQKLKG